MTPDIRHISVAPIFFASLQGSLSTVIGVTIALLVLQQVVFNVLAPKVMSEAVGIHPLLVFLAILIGSKAAGVAGAIFGVPVAAVIAAVNPIGELALGALRGGRATASGETASTSRAAAARARTWRAAPPGTRPRAAPGIAPQSQSLRHPACSP